MMYRVGCCGWSYFPEKGDKLINYVEAFEATKDVARELRASFLVFQSPASFKPTEENIKKARRFFSSIDREDFMLGWEVRWKDSWKRSIVKPLFEELDLEHVVDPLRQPSYRKKVGYYRLHGFGEPIMYNYIYSDEELMEITKRLKSRYVMFNNFSMYSDPKGFEEFVRKKEKKKE